jgi:catechol 1,2-dioxygenase
MSQSLLDTQEVKDLLAKVAGFGNDSGDARMKRIVHRVVADLFRTIEDFDVQPNEFWSAMGYLTELGQANEVGLLVPGLGLETFLDLRMDEAERNAGIEGGTPRTIEGPLYVAGAPLFKNEARLDDGSEEGEVLFMDGQVHDMNGKPVAGAVVDVWHANALGGYSFFDPSQPKYATTPRRAPLTARYSTQSARRSAFPRCRCWAVSCARPCPCCGRWPLAIRTRRSRKPRRSSLRTCTTPSR